MCELNRFYDHCDYLVVQSLSNGPSPVLGLDTKLVKPLLVKHASSGSG